VPDLLHTVESNPEEKKVIFIVHILYYHKLQKYKENNVLYQKFLKIKIIKCKNQQFLGKKIGKNPK
jgi:hypothetical protein